MSNNTSIADYQQSFTAILTGASANAADLVGTETVQAALAEAAAEILAAQARQSHFKSLAQQATRDQEDALARAKASYSRLRSGIVMHYGGTSEKLVEFGLQPRRAAVRVKPKPPAPEAPKPLPAMASTGPNPQTAVPETDGARQAA